MSNPFDITRIRAMEILDSRGNPTVQVEVFTKGGYGWAAVPSGVSRGRYEAVELRDKDHMRYAGRGVSKAVRNVEKTLSKPLIGMDCRHQRAIDDKLISLDGTDAKTKLGANALLGVSLAVAVAAADSAHEPLYRSLRKQKQYVLPVPMMNIINGAKHAGNQLAIQEFIIMPQGFTDFLDALRAGVEIYHTLGIVLLDRYGMVGKNLGDEGGFAPPMNYSREALNAIVHAIEQAGYKPGKEISLALDAAANEFFENQLYAIDGRELAPDELLDYYRVLCEEYPLISIEDPFEENDFQSFADLTKTLGNQIQIVGDDLFVSNTTRLQIGIEHHSATALLLKVNQIGTLSEALDAAQLAIDSGLDVIVSHRSGETENTFIADLAVALSCGQIKCGAPARSDRTAKYNRLIKIANDLGTTGRYAGSNFRFCK